MHKLLFCVKKSKKCTRFILVVPTGWDNIIQENWEIPSFTFENFAHFNRSQLINQALENTCLFEYIKADGLGVISILLEMFRFREKLNSGMKIKHLKFTLVFWKRNGFKCSTESYDFVWSFTMSVAELTMYLLLYILLTKSD